MTRLLLLLAGACLWLAACTSAPSTSLSDRLVDPGGTSPLIDENRLMAVIDQLPNRSGFVTSSQGLPIFWRAFEPAHYNLRYRYDGPHLDMGRAMDMDFSIDPQGAQQPLPVRGTVVLLHGWMMNGDSMLPWSMQLAQAGYRVITLDLRNHGRSGHGPAGYGTTESLETADVINTLRARGVVQGPLYLFGVSYGAATALLTAQRLGDQVTGVVALEPFANAGAAIRSMVPHMLTMQPHGFKAQAVASLARWKYGGQDIDAVIAAASQSTGVDLDEVDLRHTVATLPACVLLLHGDQDQHIPVEQGRELALTSPRVHYIEMRGEDHITLPMRLDLLGGIVDDWLASDQSAPAGICPAPRLPMEANMMALYQHEAAETVEQAASESPAGAERWTAQTAP